MQWCIDFINPILSTYTFLGIAPWGDGFVGFSPRRRCKFELHTLTKIPWVMLLRGNIGFSTI